MTNSALHHDTQPFARVYLENERADSLLTAAFSKPRILRGDVRALERYQQFLLRRVDIADPTMGQRALVVSQVLDKAKVAWFLVLLLIISSPLGIIAGIRSHRVDVGFAVNTGVFVMVATLQSLAAWMLG